MKISHNFDGGNIRCLDISDVSDIQLAIKKDNKADFSQWFYFKVTGAKLQDCRMRILNASEVSYPQGWQGYQAVASYDRQSWFRVDTEFDGSVLTINHRPEHDVVYYAYFAPYSMERHHGLMANAQLSCLVEHFHLGYTLDGQDIELLQIGQTGEGKKVCWLIARQHPGETMAQWWMEGMLNSLLDPADPIARELLKQAVFFVVPNMNPDGSRRGNLRTNSAGTDLNREWDNPSAERSPEVFFVRQKMAKTGVDFCLDVHGDEALPYNFIAGAQGIIGWNEQRQQQLDCYQQALVNASPDFQTAIGYPKALPGQAKMTTSTNYIAHTFNCLAMTLEMPFKDTVDSPDADFGWSPERARQLGVASLNALYQTVAKL